MHQADPVDAILRPPFPCALNSKDLQVLVHVPPACIAWNLCSGHVVPAGLGAVKSFFALNLHCCCVSRYIDGVDETGAPLGAFTESAALARVHRHGQL